MVKRKIIIFAMLALILVSLNGCDNENNNMTVVQDNIDTKDMIYESCVINVDGIEGSLEKSVYRNEHVYFVTEQNENENAKKKVQKVYSVHMDGSHLEEIPLKIKENEYIDKFDIDANGNFIYLSRNVEEVTDYDGREVYSADLVKTAVDGTELDRIECDDFLDKKKEKDVYDFSLDANGNVVLYGGNTLYYVEADFGNVEKIKKVGLDDLYGTLFLKDGTILCHGYTDSGVSEEFVTIDLEENKVKKADNIKISGFVLETFPGFGDYDFCYANMSGIYGYNIESQVWTGIMDFMSTGIGIDELFGMISMGDGRFLGIPPKEESSSFVVYTKQENSEADARTEIYYGTIGIEEEIRAAIVEFNKSNENYRIVIKDYFEEEDPVTKMNLDIAAGNAPDVIDLAACNADEYISKGLVEDLTPYLEKDSDIGEDDFIPSLLEAMQIDGRVYYIPPSFQLSTLVGRQSDVGTGTGWTFEEFNNLLAGKPADVRPFVSDNHIDILASLLDAGESDYIDWQTGVCSFDSENYKNILKIAKERGVDSEYDYEKADDVAKEIMNGNILFNVGFVGLDDIQIYDYLYGGDYNYIGYPNSERDGSYYFFPIQMGIYTKSDNKEGAWEFVRTFLTKEYQGTMMSEINAPTRQDCFDLMIEGAMAEKEYVNAMGKEVHPRDKECHIGGGSIKLGPLSQEQANAYVDLVKRTRKVGYFNDAVTEILLEEAQNYFSGKNSLDEAVEYTQNRVSTYVNEQR